MELGLRYLQQLRQLRDIRRNPPRLIFGEQLGRRARHDFAEMAAKCSEISQARWLRSYPEPNRHSDQRNNDTDEAETKHDAIRIELW